MKAVLCALVATLAFPALALADPSTSPGYTAADQAQFAKLASANGTWTCIDNPPSTKPDILTAKQAGNWYVWSETGDQPNVTYVRWNQTLKGYTQIAIDDSGTSEIYTTMSSDPFNATWKPVFPVFAGLYPYKMTSHGNTFTATGKYKDAKTRKVRTFKGVCTKS